MHDFFCSYGHRRYERRARKRARRLMKHVARAWTYQYPIWMDARAGDDYVARRSLRRMWLLFAAIEAVARMFWRRGGNEYGADGDDGWDAPLHSPDWWPRRRSQPRAFLPQQSAPLVSRATVESA